MTLRYSCRALFDACPTSFDAVRLLWRSILHSRALYRPEKEEWWFLFLAGTVESVTLDNG